MLTTLVRALTTLASFWLDYFQDQQKGPITRAEFLARALKAAVLDPFRLLLVIREWLGLRDLVQVAGTFPLCRAVV